MIDAIVNRWRGPGGYREVLSVGLPLIFSMMSHSVMQFTDRIFLGNYSLDTIAASFPAGMASFLFLAFFMGVLRYVSIFVAQYTGAGRDERVGASLWQGIYFTLFAGAVLALIGLGGDILFGWAGHPQPIRELETIYFEILCWGGVLSLMGICLSCFYSGRGLTWPVAIANMFGALVNIPLDYALINGVWGAPEMGITGAAIATLVGATATVAVFALMIFRRENVRRFNLMDASYEKELMRRFLKFGLPGGIQFFIDMFGITVFIFLVGRLGNIDLAASNIVISIELLAFLPLLGLSISGSILVGQAIGAQQPDVGERAIGSANHIGILCMAVTSTVFLLFPVELLTLFKPRGLTPAEFSVVVDRGVVLLRFVALYCLVNAPSFNWIEGLKGAGDVHFVMWSLGLCSVGVMILPTYALVEWLSVGVYGPWSCLTLYSFSLAVVAGLRFRAGKWKLMSVIEPVPVICSGGHT